MAASRIIAPKMASLMGSASIKAARPVMRASVKAQVPSQRAFSGKLQKLIYELNRPQ
jgi:F-type H+-transporting ATPase subunit c